jgi:hypothetical protein
MDDATIVAEGVAEARARRQLPEGSTDLMYLANVLDGDVLWFALQVPANRQGIDVQNSEGMTALMYAAKRRGGDIVAMLIEKGAKTDLVNNDGKTARQLLPPPVETDPDDVEGFEYTQNLLSGGRRRKTRKSKRNGRKSRKAKKSRKH